ncbi:hypothetical protein Taro_025278 [Colocasia esculenta]|uniref:RING-type E3 ubiquitin transferase n=1 Tax=Colocasia esculenta TaxID=4460 RepID=A0A843VG36_COLES|nr:hypothetical protein [Colocasia esculenta]
MATVEGGGRQEKRPKSEGSSPSSRPVTKGTGDGDGDGAVVGALEKTKSKLSPDGRGNKDSREGLTFTIDPDVLDCPICFEELSPPIFQCYNGHIACSSCCSNVKDCPFCKSMIVLRCLAVEKVMESVKVSCPYASSGCEQVINYVNIDVHKRMCAYSPCCCPTADCTFEGPMRELYPHFIEGHRGCSVSFQYNRACSVMMRKDEHFHVLSHGQDGVLFLLLNKTNVGTGNAVMVACLGPDSMEEKYTYKVKATDQMRVSSIQLESPMTNIRSWEGTLPQKKFLLIPEELFAFNVCLEITIWKKGVSGCRNTARQKGSTPSSKPASGPRSIEAELVESCERHTNVGSYLSEAVSHFVEWNVVF